MKNRVLGLVASGLVGSLASVATAQPFVINISGATLLENFVRAPASTNDFLDVDGDGLCGSCSPFAVDQLAPQGFPFPASARWSVQYRVVGSVNGFVELSRYGSTFVTAPDTELRAITASLAYYNGQSYIIAGLPTIPPANTGNPGAAPVTSNTTTLQALRQDDPTPAGGGIRIDIAPMDVPSRWAVRIPGDADPSRDPGQAGYGQYNRKSVFPDGTIPPLGGSESNLPDLNGRNLFDPNNPGSADGNTLFDNPLAFAPVAPVVNIGAGLRQTTITNLRYLFGAGRAQNGENFMVVTRDVGSGTRNAFQNSIGQDPSWGAGDNVGGDFELPSTLTDNDFLGPTFWPSNKGGNSNAERTLRQHRLGVGYVGPERGVTGSGTGSWLSGNALEIADTINDIYGGTQPTRPFINLVLENGPNGWCIGGPATLVSLGDPRNENELGGEPGNTNPRMRNPHAAAYLNNVRRSIANFVSVPNDVSNVGMPGELLATQFILSGATDLIQDPTNPQNLIPNPAFNQSLQDDARSRSRLADARFASFNLSTIGRVPQRRTGFTYSDGVTNGLNYVDMNGNSVAYGGPLTLRNRIAGDFNGDGLRTTADVADMLAAWRHRNGGPSWTPPNGTGLSQAQGGIAGAPGSDLIIEVIGDFNGDGNFNAADLRYWADGLHIVGGNLDRKAGFIAVDSAFGGNFFGTTKSTGAVYNNGDSRADLSNAMVTAGTKATARGFAPIGADGVINADDLRYLKAELSKVAYNGAWSNYAQALQFDLSADLTGDLLLNNADIAEFYDIMGTCPADYNLDGFVDFFDFDDFSAAFEAGDPLADFNNDGFIDFFDFDDFVIAFEAGC